MKRVVVTGIGAVTPLGNSFEESWLAVKAGRSGLARVSEPALSRLPWKAAGQVRGFEPSAFLNAREIRRLDPFVQFAVAAAIMSVHDAGIAGCGSMTADHDPDTLRSLNLYIRSGGIMVGSSRGGISTLEKYFMASQQGRYAGREGRSLRRLPPYLMPSSTVGTASSCIARKLSVKGHCLGISNACASGANAVGEAFRMIRAGFDGPVIAGGSDAPLCRTGIEGYGAMGALSRTPDGTASRPFDRTRDGFVLSEGACILVLESREKALERGAGIYGEIIGYANTVDAFHPTRPDRQGAVRAIRSALMDAGVRPRSINYISSHGTSTPLGDRVEASAIEEVFGNSVATSALKSMTGHMLAASGAFEIACALMSMRENVIPPTINLREIDENCRIRVVTEKEEAYVESAVSNSFGFGGVNAVVVLKRPS